MEANPNYVHQLRKFEAVLDWQSQSNITAKLAKKSIKTKKTTREEKEKAGN